MSAGDDPELVLWIERSDWRQLALLHAAGCRAVTGDAGRCAAEPRNRANELAPCKYSEVLSL
jgi:hypothetical protein